MEKENNNYVHAVTSIMMLWTPTLQCLNGSPAYVFVCK